MLFNRIRRSCRNWWRNLTGANVIRDQDNELSKLVGRVTALEKQLNTMRKVESRSIRRLFLLAQNVAKIVKATKVSQGMPVGNDAASFTLSNGAGAWLELVIYPFQQKFTISDTTGDMADLTFTLGTNGDLTREAVLMLNGYAEFAARRSPTETDTRLAEAVNEALAPVADDNNVTV